LTLESAVLNKLSLKMEFRQTVIGKHAIRVKRHWKRAPKVIIMIKQLPISATRWQNWSQIFFATFAYKKIMKLLITPRPLKLQETISADTERLNFQKFFGARYAKFKNNQNILSI
jgi:hypothetical protein